MKWKTEGKTASHPNNLNFVWIHAAVTICLFPIAFFQSANLLSGHKTYLILRPFWGQKRDHIWYQIMKIPCLLGLFLFPKWLLLRSGNGYNFRVSVWMTFSRNNLIIGECLRLPPSYYTPVMLAQLLQGHGHGLRPLSPRRGRLANI